MIDDRDAGTPQLEALLARLRTGRRYDGYDVRDAERRMAVRQAARARCLNQTSCALASAAAPSPGRSRWTGPALDGQAAVDQARGDLRALCTLVVGDDRAPVDLGTFIADGFVDDGSGARVLACLLHLTGYRDGARWWWQWAAGAGDSTAVYCLVLDHARRGELHDARFWGHQLSSRGFVPEQWGSRADAPVMADDLPDLVAEHIVKRVHPVLGTIPVPEASLVGALEELASADASTR
ncbi:hypothetical protein [Streptomyces sp. NRRL S-495]|uniref:hypothetical protein n=1 Tax=Streptomyces sp. NRRL S-495 TaxID=1609133 RepID=UPI000695E99A|nr:hypothetical protein [Streptomyces sp. NRRL S-495]